MSGLWLSPATFRFSEWGPHRRPERNKSRLLRNARKLLFVQTCPICIYNVLQSKHSPQQIARSACEGPTAGQCGINPNCFAMLASCRSYRRVQSASTSCCSPDVSRKSSLDSSGLFVVYRESTYGGCLALQCRYGRASTMHNLVVDTCMSMCKSSVVYSYLKHGSK